MDAASKVVKESLVTICAYHQQFKKDTWEQGFQTELLIGLSRIPNEATMA